MAILVTLQFHKNFRIILTIFAKTPTGILIGSCTESINQLGENQQTTLTAVGVPSRHGDPREDHGEALPQPRQEPTPAPTSAGGRASALSPGGPRGPPTSSTGPHCLGESLGGAHPIPAQLYFLHGKERASGISELSCALMPLG